MALEVNVIAVILGNTKTNLGFSHLRLYTIVINDLVEWGAHGPGQPEPDQT